MPIVMHNIDTNMHIIMPIIMHMIVVTCLLIMLIIEKEYDCYYMPFIIAYCFLPNNCNTMLILLCP